MANSDVEVFDNVIENNQTVGILFGSYIKETEDENYYKHPRRVHITTTFKEMVKIQIPENLKYPRRAWQANC